MTGREYLENWMTPEEVDKFQINCRNLEGEKFFQEHLIIDHDSFEEFISEAFIWLKGNEPLEYWMEISNRFKPLK